MSTKIYKVIVFSALIGLFSLALGIFSAKAQTVENLPIIPIADKVILSPKALPAGFYQFNNLEIFKGPVVDEPPTTIEAIQKKEKDCEVYENGKTNRSIACAFDGENNNNFTVQIEERTTLLGVNQEPALITDFQAGEKITVSGWLSADGKTIRAAIVRNLEVKNVHQSLSGTIKRVTPEGFIMELSNGDEVTVKTPIVEGAQVTIKGVFDKINNIVSSVLSLSIKPVISDEVSAEKPASSVTPKKPSTLFKNFLKVFGL